MTLRTLLKLTMAVGLCLSPLSAFAANPVVKTVPAVPSNTLIPHDTYAGKAVTLKGTSDQQGATIQYAWDFGDGSAPATGIVTNMYVIEASHVYAGAVGTIFTARLTVTNTATAETGTQTYLVAMRNKTLPVEVNIAIDEGLWYLHRTQRRYTTAPNDLGDWLGNPAPVPSNCCFSTLGYDAVSAANVHAFLVNGYSESGDPNNPYTETVARGMKGLFTMLTTAVLPGTKTNPRGTFNPDVDGNGYGARVNQTYELYQGGSFMDAIVAAGTPNKVTTTGPAPSGSNPGILGRTYASIVEDMADYYNSCQYTGASGTLALGGWRYSCNDFPDGSANQWAAIGMIPAERHLGYMTPAAVKSANVDWNTYAQDAAGGLGYTQAGYYPWGPYATTPSGLVQFAWTAIGRGNPMWDKAETFMRDRFGNTGGPTTNPKNYYYGLFSFTKSMLLHDPDGDGVANPITLLQSSTLGVNPIDWYSAERDTNFPEAVNNTNGVARTLVNDQSAFGYWNGHNYDGNQYRFETAWAIIMLNRTLFAAGAPVAVISATPNPAVAGQLIVLDGGGSFHQDPTKIIDSWEWDLDNDGTYETPGVTAMVSFPVVGSYPVGLRVTDNANPEASATTILTLLVTTPPIAPTANAGGPYNLCTNRTPWFLDGSASNNPDDGQSEPGQPADFITSYSWDLDGNGTFGDVTGATPNVTGQFAIGSYLVSLKVTDNTALSYPSSGMGNLSSVSSAQVVVRAGTDPACACVSDLSARPKQNKAEVSWTANPSADHYNVYRGTVAGGPYVKIASVTGGFYLDNGPLTLNATYYYIVREAQASGAETCQSNEAMARTSRR